MTLFLRKVQKREKIWISNCRPYCLCIYWFVHGSNRKLQQSQDNQGEEWVDSWIWLELVPCSAIPVIIWKFKWPKSNVLMQQILVISVSQVQVSGLWFASTIFHEHPPLCFLGDISLVIVHEPMSIATDKHTFPTCINCGPAYRITQSCFSYCY